MSLEKMPIGVLAVLIVERALCSCRVNSCFAPLFRRQMTLPQKFRMRVAAKVQERYMRNHCGEGRIDACGNPEPGRGNQAVRAAAEEASLTSTPRRGASPN